MKKLMVLLATALVATTSMAADTLWTGNIDNDWATAGNWTNGVPGSADTARIYSGTADITAAAGSVNNFYVGRTNGSSTVNIAADLTVINDAYMGYASTAADVATINQTAGNVVLGDDSTDRVHFGRGAGQSTYNLSGGTLETRGDWTRFGNYDSGASTFTFNQTGGTFTDNGGTVFSMSDHANAVSYLNVSSGAFHANNTGESRIGDDGTATITINGSGAMDSSSPLFTLGHYASATGTMNVSGNGTFSYTGDDLRIGRTGHGIVNVTENGSITATGANTYMAYYTGSKADVTIDGGTFDANSTTSTRLGNYGSATVTVKGTGVMNSSSGKFMVATHGRVDAASALNVIENGTVTSSAAEFGVGFYRDTDVDAAGVASTGTVNVAGSGTLNHSGAAFSVGRSGVGTLNISENGQVNLSGKTVYVGRYYYADYNGGSGTVNMSGGSLTHSDSTGTMWVGYDGKGVFNQTGGDLEVARLRLADDARSEGFFSISGGSLKANNYITGGTSGAGVFEVLGSGATSIEAANISFYHDTLRVVLDENGSTLMVADKAINGAYNGQIDIRGVFQLDTTGAFNGTFGDVYSIGWASSNILTDASTVFTVLSGTEFAMSILDNVDRYGNAGTGQMLQVTVIPEPATLGLLAFVGGAMLWIRRKFMI